MNEQKPKEHTILEYLEKVNKKKEELSSIYWNNNPNHQVVYCAEGLPYAVRIKEKN